MRKSFGHCLKLQGKTQKAEAQRVLLLKCKAWVITLAAQSPHGRAKGSTQLGGATPLTNEDFKPYTRSVPDRVFGAREIQPEAVSGLRREGCAEGGLQSQEGGGDPRGKPKGGSNSQTVSVGARSAAAEG